MRRMISIIEAEPVALPMVSNYTLSTFIYIQRHTHRDVNQSDAGAKVRRRIDLVHQRMLAPIAHHHRNPHQQQRQQKDKRRRPRIRTHKQHRQHSVRAQLPARSLRRHPVLALLRKVKRQLNPDQKQEPAHVRQEITQLVSLVAYRRRQVLGPVPFDMVVLDVMVVVGVPRMAHQRVRDVREQHVEQPVLAVQNAAHVDVLVHHQRVRAHVPPLHQQVQHAVQPAEAVEEQHRARHGGAEVQQQVCEHRHVCLDPDKPPRPGDVRPDQPLLHRRREGQLLRVPRDEDGRIEVRMRRVVQVPQVLDGLLLVFRVV